MAYARTYASPPLGPAPGPPPGGSAAYPSSLSPVPFSSSPAPGIGQRGGPPVSMSGAFSPPPGPGPGPGGLPPPRNYGYGSSPLPAQYSAMSMSASASGSSVASARVRSPPSSMAGGAQGHGHRQAPRGMGMQNGVGAMGMGRAYQGQGVPMAVAPGPGPPASASAAPMKGTLRPGQEVRVGAQTVVVDRYLSEGGYAHVYLTHSRTPIGPHGLTTHCLKRIAFGAEQAREMMPDVEKEIGVMRQLSGGSGGQGSRYIVEYLDSTVNRTQTGGYEVFILMEFCAGGGIIDLLNKRLRDRLKDSEILDIFVDVCEAVAYMHALPQPLLHRDLKIENILSHPKPSRAGALPSSFPAQPTTHTADLVFKVCDFGSTTFPASRAPRSTKEAQDLAYDLNRHTTLQYRSPEMVEPLLGLPVGLPADVWALGVLLYKLCYYTTPFEEHGPLAIVNAKYTFPSMPVYPPPLQHLIASMLVEQPSRRPTVFQVLQRAHELRGTRSENDYSHSSSHTPRQAETQPPKSHHAASSSSSNLLDFTDPADRTSQQSALAGQAALAASIAPQRRGRPTKETNGRAPSPAKALDSAPRPPGPANLGARRPGGPDLLASLDADNGNPPAAPLKQKIQVTGEQDDLKSATATPVAKDDAFGLSKNPLSQSGARAPPAQSFSDSFENSFAPKDGVTSRQKPTVAKSSTTSSRGFSDSFGGSFSPSSDGPEDAVASYKPLGEPAPADGDSSFEHRFPSLEALMAADSQPGSTPSSGRQQMRSSEPMQPQRQALSSTEALLKPHISVTGGTEATHHSSDTIENRPPQARSTHVTGTAFKQAEEEQKTASRPDFATRFSSSSVNSQASASRLDGGPRTEQPPIHRQRSPRPQSLQVPASAAARFREDSTSSAAAASRQPIRDLLTGEDDSRSSENGLHALIQPMSLNKARLGGPPPLTAKPRSLSIKSTPSGPQSAPQYGPRPPVKQESINLLHESPVEPIHPAGLGGAAETPAKLGAQKTVDSTEARQAAEVAQGRRSPQRQTAALPTDPSEKSKDSQDAAGANLQRGKTIGPSPSKPSIPRKMPAPVARRSSINAIVSRFESLSSPTEEEADQLQDMSNRTQSPPALRRAPSVTRPAVAPKPQQHRQPSLSRAPEPLPAPTPIEPAKQAAPPSDSSSPPEQRKSVNSLIAQWNQAKPPAAGTLPQSVKSRAPIGTGRRL